MKLAKIVHWRCDEPDATTYTWVPKDWTNERFKEAIKKAKTAYETALKELDEKDQGTRPKTPYNPPYNEYPELMVKEVQEIFARQKEEYKKWSDIRDKAHKPFSYFLEQEGLINFYDIDPEYEASIYWGHRHGQLLKYEDNNPADGDLQKPVDFT